jgi:hypothetical protein
MPQQPDAPFANAFLGLDDSKNWVGRLVDIDEQPSMSQFKKREDEMTLVHKWTLHDPETGAAWTDAEGEMVELWDFTNDSTRYNPKATNPDWRIAAARQRANALVGKVLDDAEVKTMISYGWRESLVGKTALLTLEWTVDRNGIDRLKVIKLRPYTAAPKANGTAPPPVEAETAAEKKARLQAEMAALEEEPAF